MSPSCPICGCPRHRRIVVRENRLAMGDAFEYAVCRECKLVRLLTKPADMARYYEGYSYHRGKRAATGPLARCYARLSGLLMKPLDRYRPRDPTWRVLDAGCATGGFLLELKEAGFRELRGIEASLEAAASRLDPSLEIACTSLADFQTEERFDLITLNQVFEHLEDPRAMLEKLRSMLRPGGRIVMSLPNYASLARMLFSGFWPGYDAPRHYFTFSPTNLRGLCGQCGLAVRRVRYISRPSQFLGSLQYLWNRLSRGKQTLEEGFFRNAKLLDLLLFPAAYLANWLRVGDMIEVHIEESEPRQDR